MKTIEFLGIPGSGKTFFEKKLITFLLKKNLKIYNFSSLFFEKYPLLFKISLFKKIKFFIKNKLLVQNNYFLRIINYYFDKIYKFEKEYRGVNQKPEIAKFKKKYFLLLKKNTKNSFFRNKLEKWLTQELSSMFISKKIKSKNEVLINSEGINQRILRLMISYENKKKLKIKDLNYKYFESDIVIYVDTDPKICLKRVKDRKFNYHSKNDLNNFYINSKKIYKNCKKNKFLIDKKTNIEKTFNKIALKLLK